VKEPSEKRDIWIRVLFGSVLGKTSVQFRFVLAGFGYFPSLVSVLAGGCRAEAQCCAELLKASQPM